LAGLAAGTVDIVIGTHRLLSRDIHFKDLGLVVVDDRLIEHAIAAPELIARVRASLRAMKITRMPRSRFDAQ
jgi:transcription-repair coupling factor (superfamily II helicase)